MLIYAHRGVSATYPENTMLAFRAALAAGVDGIELDVHATADGIPVIIHDRDVARTTNGSGFVDALSLAELQSLDAGGGERVPTLADVLRLVGPSVRLDIEIKDPDSWPTTLDVLRTSPRARYAISSFDWGTLRNIHLSDGQVELWPLAEEAGDELLAVAAELGSPWVALGASAYTAASAETLHRAGFGALIWTVNDVSEAQRVRQLGASALCTDDPVRLGGALRTKGP